MSTLATFLFLFNIALFVVGFFYIVYVLGSIVRDHYKYKRMLEQDRQYWKNLREELRRQ